MATSEYIDVLKFFPRRKLAERFEFLGRVEAREGLPREFVSADNAVFGFVLESRTGLEIFESSSETTTNRWGAGKLACFPSIEVLHQSSTCGARRVLFRAFL